MNNAALFKSTYDELIAATKNARQRTSLERIQAACDYLSENGIKITPASVEAYCHDRSWDGPKAQSIRNSKDALLRYLQLRRSGQTLAPAKKNQSNEPVIADESLRAYVQLLKQERDMAIAEKNRIEQGVRSLPGFNLDDLLRTNGSPPRHTLQMENALYAAPTMEKIKAIAEILLNPTVLSQCGLEIFKGRIRQASTRNILLDSSAVKILELSLNSIF